MDVRQSVYDLLEDELAVLLFQPASLLYQLEKVAPSGVLHHNEEVLGGLEDFEQADDIRVLDFLEQVHLLEDFPLAEVVPHVLLLDRLDGDTLASELVHAEGHFAESALSDELDELVELERGRR